jgi:hypothetical protein
MSQLALFDLNDITHDSFICDEPDEIIDQQDYVVEIYRPKERHFNAWLRDVDETIRDMTGYSVHDFAVVPTFGGWSDWPVEPYDAARAMLRQDVWG